MNDEEKQLLKSLGIDESVLEEAQAPPTTSLSSSSSDPAPPASLWWKEGVAAAATATVGAALAFNVAILLSLPSVLRGRGAPYLPSNRRSMDRMFEFLRSQPDIRPILLKSQQRRQQQPRSLAGAAAAPSDVSPSPNRAAKSDDDDDDDDKRLKFVDLGSGDGRWVFRAAAGHPDLFRISVGYEINPLLHLYASARLWLRRAWQSPLAFARRKVKAGDGDGGLSCSTELYRQDLWTVPLDDANVVAVYGLGPIMKELGAKLERELPPGSYVLSNVFAVPGWEPIAASNSSAAPGSATYHVYRLPQRPPLPSHRSSGSS